MSLPPALTDDPFALTAPDEAAEREALARAIEMSRDFTLLFAICNQAEHRDRLMAELVAQLPGLRVQLVALREPVRNLLVELRTLLESPPPDAVFLYGVEGWLASGVDGEDNPFIRNLNATRNHFPREVPIPLVFWAPQHILTSLVRGAPDFCSVRSGLYSFCSTPEVRDLVTESLTSDDMSVMAGLPFDEKLERINALAMMLAEYESLPPELRDPVAESRLLNSLATLHQVLGHFKIAGSLFQQVLEIKEASLGPDDPDTATSLNNLAGVFEAQGRFPEAEPLLRRALRIKEVSLGRDHPSSATALNNLAYLYKSMGRYAEAEPLYRKSLEIKEAWLGPDHPDTAASLNNLALLYRILGRQTEAKSLLRRALKIDEASLGPNHPGVATDLNNLAGLYKSLGRYAEAEPLFRRALEICEAMLSSNHPSTAIVLENYAKLLYELGQEVKAKTMKERAQAARDAHARCDAEASAEMIVK